MKNSSCSVSYGLGLVAINRVFYFRASIPRRLRGKIGVTEFKISLETPYLTQAREFARVLQGKAQQIFSKLSKGDFDSMNHDTIKKLALQYLRDALRTDEEWRAYRNKRRGVEDAECMSETASLLQSDMREALATDSYACIEDTAKEVIEQAAESGLDVADIAEGASYRLLCRELLKARIKLLGIVEKRELGVYEDDDIKPENTPSTAPDTLAATSATVQTYPLFTEAVESYINQRSEAARGKPRWSQNTANQHRGSLNILLFTMGDTPVNNINMEAVERYKRYLLKAPHNVNKRPQYRDKSFAEVMAMQIPEEDKMSDQTLKDHFTRVNAFFDWLNSRYGLSLSYRELLQIRLKENPQEATSVYTQEELTTIFHSEPYRNFEHQKAAYFWVPLLSLFTGARLEEVSQLQTGDLKQTESGLWYLDINTEDEDKHLKNNNAIRAVPLHDELVALGLVERFEFLKLQGITRLFPELKKTPSRNKYGDDVSRWFTAFRLQVGIGSANKSKHKFHSFRHTFINYFKQLGYENTDAWATLLEAVGHSRGTSQSSVRYGKSLNPEITYERIISKLDYGLDLSHLRNSRYVYMVEKDPPKTGPKPKK